MILTKESMYEIYQRKPSRKKEIWGKLSTFQLIVNFQFKATDLNQDGTLGDSPVINTFDKRLIQKCF